MSKIKPNFKQCDSRWAKIEYGIKGTTLCSSGCGPTSIAEALNFWTIYQSPPEVAKMCVERGYRIKNRGTNPTAIITIPANFGLSSAKIQPAKLADAFCANPDQIAILHMSGYYSRNFSGGKKENQNYFTKGGHYIIAYGYDDQTQKFELNDVGTTKPHRNGWIGEMIVLQNCNLAWMIGDKKILSSKCLN